MTRTLGKAASWGGGEGAERLIKGSCPYSQVVLSSCHACWTASRRIAGNVASPAKASVGGVEQSSNSKAEVLFFLISGADGRAAEGGIATSIEVSGDFIQSCRHTHRKHEVDAAAQRAPSNYCCTLDEVIDV